MFPFTGEDCSDTNKTCEKAWNGIGCGKNYLVLEYSDSTSRCECKCMDKYLGVNCEIGTLCTTGQLNWTC